MKRCVSCDAELNDSAKFCGYCGGSEFRSVETAEAETSKPVEETDVTPEPEAVISVTEPVTEEFLTPEPAKEETPATAPVVPAPKVVEKATEPKKVKTRKKTSGFAKFCSWICSLLLTIFLIVLSVVLMIRFSLSEQMFDSVGEKLEGNIADIEIGFLSESMDEDETLADFLFDHTRTAREQYYMYTNRDISDEVRDGIEEVLDAPFLIRFITDTMGDFVSFVLYDEGKGYIETEDIIELIDDNRKKIDSISDSEVSARFLVMMEDALKSAGITEALDLRVFEDDYESLFSTIRFIFSGIVEIILASIAFLLIVFIFLLRRDRYKAFAKTGRAFIVTAIFDLLIVAGTIVGVSFLNKEYPIGTEIYDAVLNPIRMWTAGEAAAFMVVGFIFVIIGKIVKRKY